MKHQLVSHKNVLSQRTVIVGWGTLVRSYSLLNNIFRKMLDIVMYKIRRRNKAIQELVNVKPYLARYTILPTTALQSLVDSILWQYILSTFLQIYCIHTHTLHSRICTRVTTWKGRRTKQKCWWAGASDVSPAARDITFSASECVERLSSPLSCEQTRTSRR